ncbi:MAG: molybdopterin cofactor-binding domain-containing protein [Clostridiales bacterium]
MTLDSLKFSVNGNPVCLPKERAADSLLSYLRGTACLKGTKEGCSTGHCGSCTVLIDGRPVRSCITKLSSVEGKAVETIEGLSSGGRLHPIQKAFLDVGAIQCGFCTPGMVMATKALLDQNLNPSRQDIVKALKRNYCRCTGYVKIIEAVELAASRLREEKGLSSGNPAETAASFSVPPLSQSRLYIQQPQGEPMEKPLALYDQSLCPSQSGGEASYNYMGQPLWDADGAAKASGALNFAADLEFPGMLYGAPLWAGRPHARVLSIDTAAAKASPGVVAVLTAADVPGKNGYGILTPDQPVFCDHEVKFVRDVVALVVAETAAQAKAALSLVQVEYEDLPAVFTMQEAAAKGQVIKELTHVVGDPDAVRQEPDLLILKGHFTTPPVEHAYLEPESAIGFWDEQEGLILYAPTQSPFELRRQLTAVLNLPADKIRIVVTPLGGGFGSKADATIEPAAAVAAYCLKRPVKIVLSREESLGISTKRHPYEMDYEIGVDRQGHLRFIDAYLLSDGGPYSNLSPRVIDQACIFSVGPYRIPAARVRGQAVATNNIPASAFRGFGINQANFSMESLLDEAAEKLGIDPFELRLRNVFQLGDSTLSGEILQKSVGIRETVTLCRDAAKKAYEKYKDQYPQGTKRLGLGMASGFKNVGAGKGKVDDAGATVKLEADGSLTLYVSGIDMGQGFRTAMVQLAAEVLGCQPEAITAINGDTKLTVPHSNAVGERQTLISGSAVVGAAKEFRSRLADVLAGKGIAWAEANQEAQSGSTTAAGAAGTAAGANAGTPVAGSQYTFDPDDNSYQQLPACTPENLRQTLELLQSGQGETPSLTGSYVYIAPKTFALYDVEGRASVSKEDYKNYPAYAYTTQAAIVEVDTATGKTRVLEVIAAHDLGRLINPNVVDGQLTGSCSMGIGYALSEAFPMEEGRPKVKYYGQLGLPTIDETPLYDILMLEDPDPAGPLGAKGVSEVATVPMTPAVINAIYQAAGVRIKDLPATPAKLLAALEAKNRGQ